MINPSGIFESFNARSLTPVQVAKTFVPSRHFKDLALRRHSVVLGPRGSGKTTLLKMLQPNALESWPHQDAEAVRQSIDFTGVYVATDIAWGEQIRSLGAGGLEESTIALFSVATFTTHVFRSLVNTFISRKAQPTPAPSGYRRIRIEEDCERRICIGLCKEWRLQDIVPSFLSIRHALSARLSSLKELASCEVLLGPAERKTRLAHTSFLLLDFLQGCTNAIELFDDTLGLGENHWALMFDELELAPRWVSTTLFNCIRSTDQRLLFKLAFNPLSTAGVQLESALSPTPGQDFDQIALWYPEKREALEFCTQLLGQLLAEKKLPMRDPKKVFGNSYFETSPDEWRELGNAYGPHSRIGLRFQKLYQVDATFKRFMDDKKLNPAKLHLASSEDRAATIRKIAPLVAVREFFRSGDQSTAGRRSRKRAQLYVGAESIFAVSEGNPRWFIGIIGRMLDRWEDKEQKVPDHVQADEMTKAAARFAAMLKTLPTDLDTSLGALSVVKATARYLNRQVVMEEFRPEPPGTFVVDDKCSDELVRILGQALNAGAIIYIPEDEGQKILGSLRSRRFRVSYLLAPLFGIPIRLGPQVSLSTILGARIMRYRSGLLPFIASEFGEQER